MLDRAGQEAGPRPGAGRSRRGAGHRASPSGATCQSCQATYHVVAKPPRVRGVCDRCGGTLIQRSDDSEEIIRNRLREYIAKTRARARLLRAGDGGRCARSTPTGNIDQIFGRIYAAAVLADGLTTMAIQLKSAAEIAKLREANLIVADVLDDARGGREARGVDLGAERDRRAAASSSSRRESAFLGYSRLPGRAVHLGQRGGGPRHPAQGRGAQGRRHPGIDFGAFKDGWCGDSARTVPIGEVTPEAQAADARRPGSRSTGRSPQCVPGQPAGRHRLGGAVLRRRHAAIRWCGSSSATASAGQMHEEPAGPELRRAGKGRRLKRRAGGRHRAHGQRREPRGSGPGRRVDGCDQRW